MQALPGVVPGFLLNFPAVGCASARPLFAAPSRVPKMLPNRGATHAGFAISPRVARSDQPRRRLAGDGFTQTPQEFFFTKALPFFTIDASRFFTASKASYNNMINPPRANARRTYHCCRRPPFRWLALKKR